MDKFVVKLKRHSSSYERDQGEQPQKVFIDRGVRTVGLPRNLLQILATLFVSTATAERSFSTLRRRKTYMRTTLETASVAWLLCQCIQTARSTRTKLLKILLRVKGADQTLVLNLGVREGILLGWRKKFALKITICHESNFFSLIRMEPETSL